MRKRFKRQKRKLLLQRLRKVHVFTERELEYIDELPVNGKLEDWTTMLQRRLEPLSETGGT